MAHILTATWYESSTSNYVTINDVKVDVPYELKNGDVIKIYSNNGDSSVMFLNGNGIANIWGTVIDLSDTDVSKSITVPTTLKNIEPKFDTFQLIYKPSGVQVNRNPIQTGEQSC